MPTRTTTLSEAGDAGARVLCVSPNLPAAMERQRWCLRDYSIKATLYTGYAASVYLVG